MYYLSLQFSLNPLLIEYSGPKNFNMINFKTVFLWQYEIVLLNESVICEGLSVSESGENHQVILQLLMINL